MAVILSRMSMALFRTRGVSPASVMPVLGLRSVAMLSVLF